MPGARSGAAGFVARAWRTWLAAGFLAVHTTGLLAVPPRPQPARFVNDFAEVLLPEQRDELEAKLVAFDAETSTQIVIVTVPELEGQVLEEVSIRLAERWGVGQKGKDNGLIILAALAERKVRIEVGYGLEGAVPDAIARRVIDGYLAPNFKNDRYYEGFDQATEVLIGLTRGEFTADDLRRTTSYSADDLLIGRIFIYLFGGIFILFALFSALSSEGLARLPGFAVGAGLAGWFYATEAAYWPNYQDGWFWLRLILVPIGLFALFLFYFIARSRRDVRHAGLLNRAKKAKRWEALKRRYDGRQVIKAQEELVAAIESAPVKNATIVAFERKLTAYFQKPDDFFTRRNDADLIDLQEEIEEDGMLASPAYPESAREKWAAFLKNELSYFKARKLDRLDPDDGARREDSLRQLRALREDPAAVLGVDGEWVAGECRVFMDGEKGKAEWKSWRGKFTPASIEAAQKRFRARYEAALAAGATAELAEFYRKFVAAIRAKPDRFLVPRASAAAAARSRRNSSSSLFSGSGSFSSGGSSSSFGGGSFGGGGASGSW